MADLATHLSELLASAFDGFDPIVRPSDRADFQANGVLALAKSRAVNPRDLATETVAKAVDLLAGIAHAEVAGPGFVNLTLDSGFLEEQINRVSRDSRLGVVVAELPERVVVDYSAPNVAKEMHVGHLRSTVIGDALVRVLMFLGHDVIRENHIGDWGTPFGMLIEHLLDVGEHNTVGDHSSTDLTEFYREARIKFDASDEFQSRARDRVVRLQGGDVETLRLWQVLIDQSANEFQKVYERLGVLLTKDDIVGESFYNPMLANVVTDLDHLGLLAESNGAKVVFPGGFMNREGEPLPLIVENSQGGSNYATTDLATVRDRVDRLRATRLVYVVGTPQAQHFAMVWKVAELAGWLKPPTRCVHAGFGSVLGDDGKMLRTRSGDPVKLLDLLIEAETRASLAIAERSPHIVDAERSSLSRSISLAAIKYTDLSNDRTKDYVFSWDRMLAPEGNTGPYLQYAHARIQSILRRAREQEPPLPFGPIRVEGPQERALVLAILGFERAIVETSDKLAPHRLCTYLFDLAQTFTSFYDACPVLPATEPTRASRLSLCELTARVLRSGLELLGIDAPLRM